MSVDAYDGYNGDHAPQNQWYLPSHPLQSKFVDSSARGLREQLSI